MRRLFLIVGLMCLVMQSVNVQAHGIGGCGNAVKLGSAKFSVLMQVFDPAGKTFDETFNVDSLMSKTDIYVGTLSLFDRYGDEKRVLMERDRGVYHAEVPLDCIEEVCGIRVYVNSEFAGGSQVILNQEKVTGVKIAMTTDGQLTGMYYTDGTTLKDWINVAGIMDAAMCMEPSDFTPKNKELYKSWQTMRDYEAKSLWPGFYEKCTSEYSIPAKMSGWVTNNLKSFFASRCVLPYVSNAKEFGNLTVTEPPMGAYSFLDSIDYTPDVFLLSNMMFSRRRLLEEILDYPCGGLEKIGETPVAEWQKMIGSRLSPAIKDCPKLLLDLLAGMSYVEQIDKNEPLTKIQKKNIAIGFTDDIGKIVLARNERLSAKE